ncbi:hypothetical protein [Streptomyces sp. NPDC058307]|uniref:hypothetical protein n=1 Tax=Streptomyces sp. NPDC058307 TaxID=3346439 RepID=UPI0036E5E523
MGTPAGRPGPTSVDGLTAVSVEQWQKLSADGIELFDLQAVTVTRYRYRVNTILNLWTRLNHA